MKSKFKGLSKDKIIGVLQAKGWFWIDHYGGLRKTMRELVASGHAVQEFKNRHGVYYVRPKGKVKDTRNEHSIN